MLSVTSIYLMCFLAWVVFGLVCLQQFRSGYSSVGCFLAASWKCRLLRSHYTCVVYNRGIHCEAIWLCTVTVTVYKPAATLNCFKTAWNQWNKCCYVYFWAICWREMYNWLTSGTLGKTRGLGWRHHYWLHDVSMLSFVKFIFMLWVGVAEDYEDSAIDSSAYSFSPDAQPFTPRTSSGSLPVMTDEPVVCGRTSSCVLSPNAPEFVPKNFIPTKVLTFY